MTIVLPRASCCALIAGLLITMIVRPLPAVTLYVAPDGNDTWSGKLVRPNTQRIDGPLATPVGARNAVRRLKAQGPLKEPVHVQLAEGIYRLNETLVFEPRDGGTAEAPIIYEGAAGAKPLISGGRPITGFMPAEKGRWKVHLPDVAAGKWYFEDLYVNGRRAIRARSPNQFYYYARSAAKLAVNPETGKTELMPYRAFAADPKNIAPLATLSRQQLNDAIVVGYAGWQCPVTRVASVDSQSGTVVLTCDVFIAWNIWAAGHRYHLENFEAALDAPGEWFLGRDGNLHYIPLPGEDMRRVEVTAPVVSGLVYLAGDPAARRYVEHITFKGIRFEHDRYPLPSDGFSDIQAAVQAPGAIMGDGARNIALQDCVVSHVGAYAVWFRRGCQQCRVERCLIQDMSAGGIRVGQGWYNDHNLTWNTPLIRPGSTRGPEPLLPHDATGHCVIDNNIVRSGGHLFRSAVGIWIGHSGYNQVTHNDVADLRYTGISVGWRWGFTPPTEAHHNKIEFNHIHNIGWGVLGDLGGIYTLGSGPGTVISNNHIHDVYANFAGVGLYNDEGSYGAVEENNLVYDIDWAAYHQNQTGENLVRNNIFAFGRSDAPLKTYSWGCRAPLSVSNARLAFRNNIVYWDGGPLLAKASWMDSDGTKPILMQKNLYFDASGSAVTFGKLDFAAWQALGKDAGSLVADPQFVDVKNRDFHLQPDSPATKIGFVPFDFTKAGVYGREDWKKEAESVQYPPVRMPSQ